MVSILRKCRVAPSLPKRSHPVRLPHWRRSRRWSRRNFSQKMESAQFLAEAEVTRAKGAAQANHILQNSLGGPDGYLRYLTIQAYENTHAQLIYVPTEAGIPITEARRLPVQEK